MVINNEAFEAALQNKEYRKIINYILAKYRRSISHDDLEQCGKIGLWKFLLKDVQKSYLFSYIEWECKSFLYKNKLKENLCADLSIYEDFGASFSPERYNIQECLDKLNPFDRNLLRDYYIIGKTMQEIGLERGFSKQTVSNKMKLALRRLKSVYTNSDK